MSEASMSKPTGTVEVTQAQQKARRQRSIAIGLCLAAFVIILYVVTWVKLGPEVLNRPI